jgi:hypothetical protein
LSEGNAGAQGTYALTFSDLDALVQNGRELIKRVGSAPESQRKDVASQALLDLELTPDQIVSRLAYFKVG